MFLKTRPRSIFDQSGIESIITELAGNEYRTGGTESVSAGDGIGKSISVRLANASATAANQWRTSASPS